MTNYNEKTLIIWNILTFNTQKTFPPSRKSYYLNWHPLKKSQIDEILNIFDDTQFNNISMQSPHLPTFDNIKLSTSNRNNDIKRKEIIKYRQFFKECNENIYKTIKHESIACFVLHDYFEDHEGNRVVASPSEKKLYPYVKNNNGLCLGSLQSILSLGNSPLRNRDKWSQQNSDNIGHFIQISTAIINSSWMNYRPESKVINGKTIDFKMPDIESIVFVLLYYRQLIEEDLLNQAYNIYRHQITCPTKICWIEWEKDDFFNELNRYISNFNLKNKELLNAFFYGALIAHSSKRIKDKNNISRFESLYNRKDKESVVIAMYSCIRFLTWHLSNIAGLIHNEFTYWLTNEDLPVPNILWQKSMFNWNNEDGT